jgi:hypothetical protein
MLWAGAPANGTCRQSAFLTFSARLRLGAPLVTRAAGTGSHRAVDAAGLCEALRQAAEE